MCDGGDAADAQDVAHVAGRVQVRVVARVDRVHVHDVRGRVGAPGGAWHVIVIASQSSCSRLPRDLDFDAVDEARVLFHAAYFSASAQFKPSAEQSPGG